MFGSTRWNVDPNITPSQFQQGPGPAKGGFAQARPDPGHPVTPEGPHTVSLPTPRLGHSGPANPRRPIPDAPVRPCHSGPAKLRPLPSRLAASDPAAEQRGALAAPTGVDAIRDRRNRHPDCHPDNLQRPLTGRAVSRRLHDEHRSPHRFWHACRGHSSCFAIVSGNARHRPADLSAAATGPGTRANGHGTTSSISPCAP